MPARPSWYAKVPAIRRVLLKSEVPSLDRASIESLFGVKARQANNIVRTLGGYKVGTSHIVNRLDLLDKLEELSRARGVALAETQRKANVVEALDSLRQEARPVRIPRPKPAATHSTLPESLSVPAAGQLLIRHSGAQDLLSHVLALVQMANANFAGFTEAIAGPEVAVGSLQTAPEEEATNAC